VLNREDQRIARLKQFAASKQVAYFGLSQKLLSKFPSDDNLHGGSKISSQESAEVELIDFKDSTASFKIGDRILTTNLKINGIYNVFNAAAAIALVKVVLDGAMDKRKLVESIANVKPAFGRGELFVIGGQPLQLVLVKNPSGFRLGLESFDPAGCATMIAINDNYADGRDMSWLWDVDFESLKVRGVDQVSGIRAYDMGLRLKYDEVTINHIDTNLEKALKRFLSANRETPKRIYCTYTAMLTVRKQLSKVTKVEVIK
jgi:UDP-N-acetylmuramyl tripeptide synthase